MHRFAKRTKCKTIKECGLQQAEALSVADYKEPQSKEHALLNMP